VHTSTWPGRLLTQRAGTGTTAQAEERTGMRATLSRSLRGVSWMMSWRRRVETPVGGPVSSVHGRHTGASALALLREHGLGTCTGCRAGCQMWPAKAGHLSVSRWRRLCYAERLLRPELHSDAPQGGWSVVGPIHRPVGLTAEGCVSKRRCVWNRPVYGRASSPFLRRR